MATKYNTGRKVKHQAAYVSQHSTSIQFNCLLELTGQQLLAWRLATEATRMTSGCKFSRPQTRIQMRHTHPDATQIHAGGARLY